ncbi:MAG: SEC-C metal-binding domain-containing protein [Desulfovermiculus sp.]|nr:SEC-C metal-binding domain-containing protein [Desulfovermiculus sp.]
MGSKIGRNDPCWCGSGRKYKKCHLGRDKAPRMNPFVAEQELKKNFSEKYCLHPEATKGLCKGSIARAHTIQRSGGLSRIAENGHVYSLKPSMKMLIELNGKVAPTSIGINQASTFTGFCRFHDSETFKTLERQPFVATDEQCFLLTYRAFSREFFTKRAMSKSIDIHRQSDTGLPLQAQMEIQNLVSQQELVASKDIAEMEEHKNTLDTWLVSKDYAGLNYCVFYLDSIPSLST